MSHDRPIKRSGSPKSETTVIPKMADDLTKDKVAPSLDIESQTRLLMVSTASQQLFKKQTAVNRLLSLVAKYDLTEAEFKKLKENTPAPESKEELPIRNPILLAVKAFLEKDPSLALIKGSVTDLSGRTRYDSPWEYAYWSGNFFVCQMILEKVKGNPEQEKKAFAQIRAMQDKAMNYDVVLMQASLLSTHIDENFLLGFQTIILISTNTLISSAFEVPCDAIMLQKKQEGIVAYQRVSAYEIKIEEFDLRNAVKKIKDSSIQDILSCFPEEEQRMVTKDNNADLFEKLCLLCGYSMPTKPTLIKYLDLDDESRITLWGNLNGRWQLTELTGDEQALFAHVVFPSSFDGKILPQSDITVEMYGALKRGHTVSQYDLSEFTRKAAEFFRHYPANQLVPEDDREICNANAQRLVGMTQKYFPAWIAQLWCSETRFSSMPNFWNAMTLLDFVGLKTRFGRDFFGSGLGEDFSIYKSSGNCFESDTCLTRLGLPVELFHEDVMASLCELMKAEFGKINEQLLAFENSAEISSEANRSRNSSRF